jgi:hypothetical protein
VPKRWNMNSAVRMTSVIGTIQWRSAGAATCRPSTAPSTEIAGVMTPSPKKIAVPKMPTKRSVRRSAGLFLHRPRGEREHRDQAALAVVVGAQDEDDVLDRDDHRDRPEDEREDAVDVGRPRAARGRSRTPA